MPRATTSPFPELRGRLEVVEDAGRTLQAEGLPFPTVQVRQAFDEAVRAGATVQARTIVKRAEILLERTQRDWTWLRELLKRVDELRGVAEAVGVDLTLVDARVGNPRAQLMGEPLSSGSLERSAAAATLALAVLNDITPKHCVQQAQALGASIRAARDRGEEVRDAALAFSLLVRTLQDEHLPSIADRLLNTRRAVARIPRAPALLSISQEEEEEILLEARNLARRLHRIRSKARDATGAVRLMTQVRQALTERRYGSPEEEIEALWSEVDRMTKEKRFAGTPPEPGEVPSSDVQAELSAPVDAGGSAEIPAEGVAAEAGPAAGALEPDVPYPLAAEEVPPIRAPRPPSFEPGEGPFPGPSIRSVVAVARPAAGPPPTPASPPTPPAEEKPPARSPIFASYIPPDVPPYAPPNPAAMARDGEPRRRPSRHRQ
jgi:hypothetical protein